MFTNFPGFRALPTLLQLAGILQIEHQIFGDFESIPSRSAMFERNLRARKPEIRKEVKSKLCNGNQLVIKIYHVGFRVIIFCGTDII